MGRIKGSKNVVKKKENEGKKIPVKIERENEGSQESVTVTRTTLRFKGVKELIAGDIIKHIRIMKVISITHLENDCANLELEIIKRTWSETNL